MAEIQWNHLEQLLLREGQTIADEYRARVRAAGKDASGALSKGVRPVLEMKGGRAVLSLVLQDYWKYLEYGTRKAAGHPQGLPPGRPMRAAILKWIQVKPVIPRPNRNTGKIPTPKQLAFLIARKIFEKGTKPFYFLYQSMPDEDSLNRRISFAVQQDIQDWINDLLK